MKLARTARMGNPLEETTQVGPITTQAAIREGARLHRHREAARRDVRARRRPGDATPSCGDGWFVEPTVFTGVTPDMRIAQEEVFGPVLSIIPFDSDEEALEIANGSIYGLAAGVWTSSINRALKMAHALEAGTVWINTYRVVEPAVAVRRLQALGLRPRERPAGDPRVRAREERLDRDDRRRRRRTRSSSANRTSNVRSFGHDSAFNRLPPEGVIQCNTKILPLSARRRTFARWRRRARAGAGRNAAAEAVRRGHRAQRDE